jgi:hypothetical protein
MTEATEAAVRAEVRAWLEANWSPDHGLVEWRNKLIDSGWGVPSWPKDWFGRELPMALEAVVEESPRPAFAGSPQRRCWCTAATRRSRSGCAAA